MVTGQDDGHQRTPEGRLRRSRAQRTKCHELIRAAKNRPCADCGRSYPYYVMDFDHVRGEKLGQIGLSRTRSLSWLTEEIAKCDVVCANCHRERTHLREQYT